MGDVYYCPPDISYQSVQNALYICPGEDDIDNDNYRKIFLALAKDYRVIVIKLVKNKIRESIKNKPITKGIVKIVSIREILN